MRNAPGAVSENGVPFLSEKVTLKAYWFPKTAKDAESENSIVKSLILPPIKIVF